MSTYTYNPNATAFVIGSEFTLLLAQDQTVTNSTTLVSVPDFNVTVGRNGRYLLEYEILFDTPAAADFKYSTLSPVGGTATRYRALAEGVTDAATAATSVLAAEAAVSITGGGTSGAARYTLFFENGGAAADQGVLGFQFAQNTADAGNTIVLAGSRVTVRSY